MRKVVLRMNEQLKYDLIKKLVDTNGNKKRVATQLHCSIRSVNRLIVTYHSFGKSGFVHGNRDRRPATTISFEIKKLVIDLYLTKYEGANLVHFSELLAKHENIKVSDVTVGSWLKEIDILSPKAHRSTKKELRRSLKHRKEISNSKKTKVTLQNKLDTIDDYAAHPRRPRCANFGEMIQMDASNHLWFGSEKSQLHLAIDDATGKIIGGYFDKEETLNGYYHVLHQILTTYGIPAMFFTDRRTVFEYKQKKDPLDDEDTFTQFSYACHQLGIEIKTSSIPQAKGRVERQNQTLQSRLVLELKLAGINTIEGANTFLNHYIKEFNEQFSLPLNDSKTVFETQPNLQKINEILAVLAPRKIDAGHCIKYKNKFYLPKTAKGNSIFMKKGTTAMVIEAFDKNLYVNILEQIFLLEEVLERHEYSKTFDVIKESVPKKEYVPPMTHPWKHASYLRYLETLKHRKDSANVS